MADHITAERLRELVHYDPGTGIFTARVKRGNCHVGDVLGTPDTKGHIVFRLDYRLYRANRMAWLYMHGSNPVYDVDHINRDKGDNHFLNLRDIPNALNRLNIAEPNANSSTRTLGVFPKRDKFFARICLGGKKIYLGTFDTEQQAAQAYWSAKASLHAPLIEASE